MDPDKLPLVSQTNVFRRYRGGYEIPPNAFFGEEEGIALPPGNYWIKATLNYVDGDYIDQASIVAVDERPGGNVKP